MTPSLKRIRSNIIAGKATESDFQILFLQTRDKKFGPFIREMGDLIAHPEKDRGPIFDRLIYHRAQVDLLANKLERLKKPELISRDGSCIWWLRHYMLARIKESHKEIFNEHRIIKSKQIKIIKDQFASQIDQFPRCIKQPLDLRFTAILQTLSNTINTRGPFTEDDAYDDISKLLLFLGIDASDILMQDILMSILVCVHNSEYHFPNGDRVRLRIGIEKRMPNDKNRSYLEIFSPHGYIMLNCSNPVEGENGVVIQVAFQFFRSTINSEAYLHEDLIKFGGELNTPYFDLDCDLEFRPDAPRVREPKLIE